MTLASNVRIQMLGSDNTTVLSDDYVNLMISDAKEITSISDETVLPLRHYVCYLIANNWESIGAVASREGVSYRAPDPSKYLKMYNDAIAKTQLSDNSDPTLFGGKVSTNYTNEFDDDGVMIKKEYY